MPRDDGHAHEPALLPLARHLHRLDQGEMMVMICREIMEYFIMAIISVGMAAVDSFIC